MAIENIPAPVAGEDNAVSAGEDTVQEKTPSRSDAGLSGCPIEVALNELPDHETQMGLKRVEAITAVWSKASLISVYSLIFLLCFVISLQESMTVILTPYVLSNFSLHSLVPVIYIVSYIASGALYLPTSRMLSHWGRSKGFIVMMSVATIGLVLMAVCQNIETFGAAQIIHSVGFSGMAYSLEVITADTSSLNNRGLAFAFIASPTIITAFVGPVVAEGFYDEVNIRWAFGCFAIILPFVALPLWCLLQFNQNRAKKRGLLVKESSNKTLMQSVWHYLIEFNAFGVLLLATGLVLFLLPFSLADTTAKEWRSPSIIGMLISGVCLLVLFGLTERYMARRPFVPSTLFVSATILGACLLSATFQIAYYCWASYFSSYLQVVNGLTIAQAGYIGGIFDVISGLWIIVVGYAIRFSGRYKWLLLCAVPLYTFAVGLMIFFRRPHIKIGYVVIPQILIAFGGGTIVLCQQVAVMAVAEHRDLAAVLAVLGLFGNIGSAVGNTISGAIWTNTLPRALDRLLPESAKASAGDIYGDLATQLSYPLGSPVRHAIIEAYAMTQRRMLIAGTSIMALSLIWVLILKNVKVSDVQQVKGLLF